MDAAGGRDDPRQALATLMVAYQGGDEMAFERLYEELSGPVRAFLRSLTRNATRADDLLQETFFHVHRARQTYDPNRSAKAWVYAIAHNVFLMSCRSEKRRGRHEELAEDELPDVPVPAEAEAYCHEGRRQEGARPALRRQEGGGDPPPRPGTLLPGGRHRPWHHHDGRQAPVAPGHGRAASNPEGGSDTVSGSTPLPPELRRLVRSDLRPVRPLASPARRALVLLVWAPVAVALVLAIAPPGPTPRTSDGSSAGASSSRSSSRGPARTLALGEAVPGRGAGRLAGADRTRRRGVALRRPGLPRARRERGRSRSRPLVSHGPACLSLTGLLGLTGPRRRRGPDPEVHPSARLVRRAPRGRGNGTDGRRRPPPRLPGHSPCARPRLARGGHRRAGASRGRLRARPGVPRAAEDGSEARGAPRLARNIREALKTTVAGSAFGQHIERCLARPGPGPCATSRVAVRDGPEHPYPRRKSMDVSSLEATSDALHVISCPERLVHVIGVSNGTDKSPSRWPRASTARAS